MPISIKFYAILCHDPNPSEARRSEANKRSEFAEQLGGLGAPPGPNFDTLGGGISFDLSVFIDEN